MSVAKVSEISATSSKSFEDAIQQGIARASKTLRNIRGAWIKEQHVRCDERQDRGIPGQHDGHIRARRLGCQHYNNMVTPAWGGAVVRSLEVSHGFERHVRVRDPDGEGQVPGQR